MKYADLHIHTCYSDGTFTPAHIIALAKKAGLSCISITDHDSVDAYQNNHLPAEEDIEIIPGVEFTSNYNNIEVHILGYYIDYSGAWFQERLKAICSDRIKRMEQMCQKLNRLGMSLNIEEVLKFAGHSCVGRLHLAQVMARKGFVAHPQKAFDKYIADNGPAYVSNFRLKPQEVIDVILKAKGVPVLAHPYSLPSKELIPELAKAGLMGIEGIYSEHSPSQVAHYKKLAQEHDLLITGGSDFHGDAKPEVKIGIAKIPYTLIETLKNAHQKVLAR